MPKWGVPKSRKAETTAHSLAGFANEKRSETAIDSGRSALIASFSRVSSAGSGRRRIEPSQRSAFVHAESQVLWR